MPSFVRRPSARGNITRLLDDGIFLCNTGINIKQYIWKGRKRKLLILIYNDKRLHSRFSNAMGCVNEFFLMSNLNIIKQKG